MTRTGPARLLPVMAAMAAMTLGAGCRRASSLCPQGWKEERAGADAFWCRQGDQARYHQVHATTRRLRQTCRYKGGLADGPFQGWHPDGQRWIEGAYAAGQLSGLWIQWDERGGKVAEGEYRDGRIVSGAPVAIAAICGTLRP